MEEVLGLKDDNKVGDSEGIEESVGCKEGNLEGSLDGM